MSNRRILVISDGAGSLARVLPFILDVARPLAIGSAHCVLVPSAGADAGRSVALLGLCGLGPPVVCTWPFSPEAHDLRGGAVAGVSAVFERWRARALARGVALGGECRGLSDVQTIVDELAPFELVFCGFDERRLADSCEQRRLLIGLLSRGTRPVLLTRRGDDRTERLVVATHADWRLDALVRWGADWARRLDVPLAIFSAAKSARRLTCQLQAVERVLKPLGIVARLSGFRCSPEDLAEKLNPSDLLLMGAYGRPWPVEMCTGSRTEAFLRQTPCPIAVLPPGAQLAADRGLAPSGTRGDNRGAGFSRYRLAAG